MLTKIILTFIGGAVGGVLSKLYLEEKEPTFLRNIRMKKTEWIIHKLYLEKEINIEINNNEVNEDYEFNDFDLLGFNDQLNELKINIIKIYKFIKFINEKSEFKNEACKDISITCTLALENIDELEKTFSNLDVSIYNMALKSYIKLMEKMAFETYFFDDHLDSLDNIYKKAMNCLTKLSNQ